MFHNQTDMPIDDAFGIAVPVGGSRRKHPECVCSPDEWHRPVPCKVYRCVGCKRMRPYCCGGAPDERCDHCVAA